MVAVEVFILSRLYYSGTLLSRHSLPSFGLLRNNWSSGIRDYPTESDSGLMLLKLLLMVQLPSVTEFTGSFLPRLGLSFPDPSLLALTSKVFIPSAHVGHCSVLFTSSFLPLILLTYFLSLESASIEARQEAAPLGSCSTADPPHHCTTTCLCHPFFPDFLEGCHRT